MKGLKPIIYVLGLVAGTAIALPFCLQNAEGLKCWYETYAECEDVRSRQDMCLRNPSLDGKQEEGVYFDLPEFSDKLHLGPILYKYSQEVCSEEERKVDQPLRCEPDPTP